MNKLLKEVRKGEEDNILSFEPIMKPPDGRDWLRELPFGTRFLATKKGVSTPWAESFGIGHITDGGILLATESDYHPGIAWKWAISHEFSRRYILLQILPEVKNPLEEGDGDNNGNDGNSEDNPS
jgi:hypothetical protein